MSFREDDAYWEEVRQAVGTGTRSVLWGTSTRSLRRSLDRLRKQGAPLARVTRVEVIDHAPGKVSYSPEVPRSVVAREVNVKLIFQDDGRTLKVFLTRREN